MDKDFIIFSAALTKGGAGRLRVDFAVVTVVIDSVCLKDFV